MIAALECTNRCMIILVGSILFVIVHHVSGLVTSQVSNTRESKVTSRPGTTGSLGSIFPRHETESPFTEWERYEYLRSSDLDKEIIDDFFGKRPHVIAQRLVKVSATLWRARRQWKQSEILIDTNNDAATINESDKKEVKISSDPGTDDAFEKRALDLCSAVSSLGPVAVKIGQTLSQRPDIVGHDAASALQRLQTRNLPYPNEWAYRVLRSELGWDEAAIAPDIVDEGLVNPTAKPLFAKMTVDPVACASLGQVYKATLWDGREVAVKIQRPDAMSILAKDIQCFRRVFQLRRRIERLLNQNNPDDDVDALIENKQDIGSIIDRVGRDVIKEIDYELEAENAREFRESLAFLGFVTTPEAVPEYCTKRVLVTEWVKGAHLSDLESIEDGLTMTRMAVEACTASMVLTGFVHADPHEGNLMLHEDGRVVFLDFGLMSRVDQDVMEGFARGIQALLSEDWRTLTESFVDVGFVIQPIMHRNGPDDKWRNDPNFGIDELAAELAEAMEDTDGGKSRFGALATVLNNKISPRWLVYTPPYVLLLVRTFLTLEGIAAKLDPEFNIYEMAMPWAVRRSLSPSTQKGIETLRSTIMTPDNRIQWSRLIELASEAGENAQELDMSENETGSDLAAARKAKQEAAKKAAMQAAVLSLLGSREGRALRRALRDIDSTDLIQQLSSKQGRPLLKKACDTMKRRNKSPNAEVALQNEIQIEESDVRPVSEDCLELRKKQSRWQKKVGKILLWNHVKKQMNLKGLFALVKFSAVFTRLMASMVIRKFRDFTTTAKGSKTATTITAIVS